MTRRKRLMATLRGETVDRAPVSFYGRELASLTMKNYEMIIEIVEEN